MAMIFLKKDEWIETQMTAIVAVWSRISCYPFMTKSFEAFCDAAYELSSKRVPEYMLNDAGE